MKNIWTLRCTKIYLIALRLNFPFSLNCNISPISTQRKIPTYLLFKKSILLIRFHCSSRNKIHKQNKHDLWTNMTQLLFICTIFFTYFYINLIFFKERESKRSRDCNIGVFFRDDYITFLCAINPRSNACY